MEGLTLPPPHVAIAIATYQRPAGLQRLLASLEALEFVRAQRPRITLVVIDNDMASAISAQDFRISHPLVYRVEPAKGLANVRNACLDAAPADADFIAFVDDDEWVVPEWLDALLDMQRRTGADIVQGVVLPKYRRQAPQWMREGHYHEVGPFQHGAPLSHGASGNVLIRRSTIQDADARFHAAFNMSGGEDVDFFAHLLRFGAVMVAAADAVAYEDVPPERMTLGWIMRRRFRTGHTLGLIARRQGGAARRIVKALGRLALGFAETTIGSITSRTRAVRGLTNMAWGAGTLSAMLGPFDQHSINQH